MIIEPASPGLGDLATVEIAVMTPPDHRVPPVRTPERVPGLWLLEADPKPVVKNGGRWIHRTQIRVRTRELGAFQWPEQEVLVERPDGSRLSLILPAHPFEIHPEALAQRDLRGPYPLRDLPSPVGTSNPLVPGAVGFVAALLLVASIRQVRERRRQRSASEPDTPGSAATEPASFDAALTLAATDPRGAADLASAELRRYLAERYGVAARFRTTEELRDQTAPFAATTRWSRYLDLLDAFDAARFPRPAEDPAESVRHAIESARAVVREARPGGRSHRGSPA